MANKSIICLICEKYIEGRIFPYLEGQGPVPRSIPVCETCDEVIQSNKDVYGQFTRDEELSNVKWYPSNIKAQLEFRRKLWKMYTRKPKYGEKDD